MKFRVAAWLVALGTLLVGVTEGRAQAQTSGTTTTTTTSGPSVTAALLNPNRLINGNQQTLRNQNLNPEGISYSDCISDMVLEFSISLNSFDTGSNLLVWGGETGPCNSTAARGLDVLPVCWPVVANDGTELTGILGGSGSVDTITVDIRVQDLIAHMNAPVGNYTKATSAVCTTVQQSFTAVPLTIWFMPVDPGNVDTGTPYSYPISVDLVGPPAPVGLSDTVGDTLFNINWMPNNDSDTAGYDIYIDPIPGSTDVAVAAIGDGSVNVLVCPDAGASSTTEVGDAETDSSMDATTVSSTTGCYYTTTANNTSPSSSSSSQCGGVSVFSGTVIDGGTVIETDEAGNEIGTESGSGGISTVPSANLIGINAGFTVASPTQGTYTITGLTNGVNYHVSVSAVDAFGNIGPPAPDQCDFPAPVNDFWTNYRNDGGLAGGGFCALGAVGIPVGPTVAFGAAATGLIGVLRRRRRRR
jgi:hypothetical protein